jgi:hypothetical protein
MTTDESSSATRFICSACCEFAARPIALHSRCGRRVRRPLG